MKKILLLILIVLSSFVFISQVKAEEEISSLYALMDELGEDRYFKVSNDVIGFWSCEEAFNTYCPGSTTETYKPTDRRWVGIPYVEKTPDGRLWAVYMTGGLFEPDNLNYSVIYYSDDNGATWSDDFLIIDNINPDNHWYSPRLYYDEGKMFFFFGNRVIYTENYDCKNPKEELKVSKAYTSNVSFSHKPVKLSNGIYVNDVTKLNNDTEHVYIFGSRNCLKWEQIGYMTSAAPAYKKFCEGGICVFGDDNLLLLNRLDGGSGLERSYSRDGGYTWEDAETDLPLPLATSYTKCALATLSNGAIILVNNNSTEARLNMTAYISYDEGKTFPYQIELDGRYGFEQTYWGVSYPDIKVDENDHIYIIWDERAPLNEILFAELTEADIVAGKIVTEGSYTFKCIFRNSPYYDMISTEESFDHYVEVKKGTNLDSLTKDLPTTLHYEDSKGNKLSSTGKWVCDDFDSSKAGYYTIRFEMDTKDPYLIMNDSLCKVYVKVLPDKSDEKKDDNNEGGNTSLSFGCESMISALSLSLLLVPVTAILVVKKKKED